MHQFKGEQITKSRLPLHLALQQGAPDEIIQYLVHAFPNAVKCTTETGMLPIHLAMHHGSSYTVLLFLIKEFPGSLHCRDHHGRLAIDCAPTGSGVARIRDPSNQERRQARTWSPDLQAVVEEHHPNKNDKRKRAESFLQRVGKLHNKKIMIARRMASKNTMSHS